MKTTVTLDLPEIVSRAYDDIVVNIGQLTSDEIRMLDKWARNGLLWKTKYYYFPIPKTCWVANPF